MFTDIVKYVKSKDAGNYRFNPFLDVVEVYIKTKDNSNFDYDFKVIGNIDLIKITTI